MNKGLLAIFAGVAIYAVFMTMAMAWAEETPDTVLIPFEPNSRICGYTESGNCACEWDKAIIDLPTIFENNTSSIHEPVEAQTTIEEIIEEESEPVKVTEVIKKPTKFELDLERFEERPPVSEADKEYYELLKNLAQCQRGYAESRGIQTNDWYAISYTWIDEGYGWTKSLDYTGRHAELKKSIEECRAQRTILNPVILGEEYYTKGQYFGKSQPNHQDMTTITTEESKHIAKFAVYDKLNDRDFADTEADAREAMCNIASSYRLDYCLNPIHVDVGGSISYENKIENKWLQYQKDGGAQQAHEIRAQILSEKIAKIYGGQN